MKIGIFGGSYNPPHNMHYNIALYLLNEHYVDKVIFVPTGKMYQYKNNLEEDRHRLEMLKLMIQDDRIEVSDFELKDYTVYTCDTLEYFSSLYPDDEICFICGIDNLSYIDKWKNGLDILKKYKIVVIDRSTNDVREVLSRYVDYLDNIVVAKMDMCDISSTKIRKLIYEKKYSELSGMMNNSVVNYICKEKLYENV